MSMRYSNGQHYSVAMSDYRIAFIKGLRDGVKSPIIDPSLSITSVQAYENGICTVYVDEDPNVTWMITLPANKMSDSPRIMKISFFYYDPQTNNSEEKTLELDYDKFMDKFLGEEDTNS